LVDHRIEKCSDAIEGRRFYQRGITVNGSTGRGWEKNNASL